MRKKHIRQARTSSEERWQRLAESVLRELARAALPWLRRPLLSECKLSELALSERRLSERLPLKLMAPAQHTL